MIKLRSHQHFSLICELGAYCNTPLHEFFQRVDNCGLFSTIEIIDAWQTNCQRGQIIWQLTKRARRDLNPRPTGTCCSIH